MKTKIINRPMPKRCFSIQAALLAKKSNKYDSNNPTLEDSAAHLAKDFKNDPQGLEEHFKEKEAAINSLLDAETTGELEDIPQEELDSWEVQRVNLLERNEQVKSYTYERIEEGIDSASDTESDSSSTSVTGNSATDNQSSDATFAQDSSEVYQSDFDSSDYYED